MCSTPERTCWVWHRPLQMEAWAEGKVTCEDGLRSSPVSKTGLGLNMMQYYFIQTGSISTWDSAVSVNMQ